MASDIENLINNCEICQINRKSLKKETLIPHDIPTRSWQYVFSDFFEFNNNNFLLLVDSYSNWIEVEQTNNKTADEVIFFCKSKFKQFGVPEIFFADNVPYNSKKFKEFAKNWGFEVKFSSPHHHQSNGLAERYVGIVKDMLKKCKNKNDLNICIMEYHTTPLSKIKYSPSQIFLNRTLKTKLPVSEKALQPINIDHQEVQNKLKEKQLNQKQYYDRTAKDLPQLKIGDSVLVQQGQTWKRAEVVDRVNERSYLVKDELGTVLRRNRKFLNPTTVRPNFNLANDLYDIDINIPLNREHSISASSLSSSVNQSFMDESTYESTSEFADNDDTNNIDISYIFNEVANNDCDNNSNIRSTLDNVNSFGNGTVQETKRVRRRPNYLKDYCSEYEDSRSDCE